MNRDSTIQQNSAAKPKKATQSKRKPLSTLSVRGQDNNNSQQPIACAKLDQRVKELSQSKDVGFLYFADIMRSLRTKESKLLSDIDAGYINSTQMTISWTMRALLVEWILNIQAQYNLMDETVFAVINYVDVYLSEHNVDKKKLQLLGVTAMNLASKTYEVRPQSIHEWLYLSQGQFSKKEVLAVERKLLSTMNWNIFQVTPYNFSSSWMTILCAPAAVQFLFDFVIRVVYTNGICLKHKVSHLTAAAIYLAFVYLRRRHELDADLLVALAEHDTFQSNLFTSMNSVVCSFVRRERTNASFILETYGGADDKQARSEKYGTTDGTLSIDGIDFKRAFEEHSNEQQSNKPIKKL